MIGRTRSLAALSLGIELMDKLVDIVEVGVAMKFEGFLGHISDVFLEQQRLDKSLESSQLVVVFALVVGQDRNSILQLESIRVSSVVHQNHRGEVSPHHPQVFHVHSLRSHVAVFSEQTMVYPLLLGIQVIQHYVGIAGVTSREHDDLEILGQMSEDFNRVGTDVYSGLYFLPRRKLDFQLDVTGEIHRVVAVDESFIEVENYCLPVCILASLPLWFGRLPRVTSLLCASSWDGTRMFWKILKYCALIVRCSLTSERYSL